MLKSSQFIQAYLRLHRGNDSWPNTIKARASFFLLLLLFEICMCKLLVAYQHLRHFAASNNTSKCIENDTRCLSRVNINLDPCIIRSIIFSVSNSRYNIAHFPPRYIIINETNLWSRDRASWSNIRADFEQQLRVWNIILRRKLTHEIIENESNYDYPITIIRVT